MKKLWEKHTKQSKSAEQYCFGMGVVLDNNLVEYDALGSIAHAKMLVSIGVLTNEEYRALHTCLNQIIDLSKTGKFVVGEGDEDVHTKIENYLVSKLGEIGKKIHTGRSRNDQVLLDLKLYTKEHLFDTAQACLDAIEAFLAFTKEHEFVPMPGYTHMQKAMPSSVGLWAGSFVESLLDDLEILKSTYLLNDSSPLGSGAAYGVPMKLDREMVATLLGFSDITNNSLYAQASRGKTHAATIHALSQCMLTASKFAQDMLLFTTSEYDFFTIDEYMCTGSSIMPQKKNLDIAEYIRSRTHTVIGYGSIVAGISAGLPSGYNADFGETKEPLIKSFDVTNQTMKMCELLITATKPNKKVLENACTQSMYATHFALDLVGKGMSFRDAYAYVGTHLTEIPIYDKEEVLHRSTHIGGTGNLGLNTIEKDVENQKIWWEKEQEIYKRAMSELMKEES